MSTETHETVVIFGEQYNSTRLPGESGGLCYTGSLLRQTGIVPVQGVAYYVTVEPIGAQIGEPPEAWMYMKNWAQADAVKQARQTLRSKSRKDAYSRKLARRVIAQHQASLKRFRSHLKEYYRMLGVKQFKATK